MTGSSGGMVKITALQNAAKAVLSVYDPSKQRVALALTGPGKVTATGAPVVCREAATARNDDANFSPETTLNAAVTKTATTIKVAAPHSVPFPAVPFGIAIDMEWMRVTAVSGTSAPFTWTVTRAVAENGIATTAATHSSGTNVDGTDPWKVNGTNVGMWVPVGLSGTDTDSPAPYPNGTNGTYSVGGSPSTSSWIVKAINCISASSMGTNLSTAIKMAQWYLDVYGRPNTIQGIILETDGQPQVGPGSNQPGTNPAFTCQAAYDAAAAAKADKTHSPDGIQFFTVGYGVTSSSLCPTRTTNLSASNTTYNVFESTTWSGKPATLLLKAMATDANHYFDNPPSSQLASVFTQAATSLVHGGAHLIQLYPAPIVTGVGSGTTVAISGKYFTGAISVRFGSALVSFTVNGDTSITAYVPSGPPTVRSSTSR